MTKLNAYYTIDKERRGTINKEAKKRKRTRLRNKKFLKRYPFAVPVDWGGNPIPKRVHKFEWTAWDDIPRGWRKAFGKELAEEIRKSLIEDGIPLAALYFQQIKEKYGELRMYSNLLTRKVDRIISDYGYISRNCCIRCGKPDVGTTRGWIYPVCEKCWNVARLIRDRSTGKSTIIKYEDEVDQEVIPDTYSYRRWSDGEEETIVCSIKEKADRIRAKYRTVVPRDMHL